MKYTKEITDNLIEDYRAGVSVALIAHNLNVPERSVIAKLSSLGVYTKKSYVNKRGETPVKKSEHIERIAELLQVNEELLESLEKVNKTLLKLIENKLSQTATESDLLEVN